MQQQLTNAAIPTGAVSAEKTQAMADADLIDVRLEAVRFATHDINLYELRSIDREALPAFTAGAHIDVHLPNNIVRQYSLVEMASAPSVYVIGVKRDAASRGGSSYLHDSIRIGAALRISRPRNNFPLDETAEHSILIAGGIGVTPIFTMWKRLRSLGRNVQMHYSSRTRSDAVFLDVLLSDPSVSLNFDDESAGKFLDIAAILERSPRHSHLYCCGPAPMLAAFEAAAADWPAGQVHVEYFTAQSEQAREGGFVVELARSKRVLQIEPGQTILSALQAAGIDAPYSCEEGVCGACMTDVIEGDPDHRDSVLTPGERKANRKIMICCSGSKSPRLVLDL